MKKDSVKLGVAYAAKVSGNVVPVRLDKVNPHGGWDGVNLTTKKPVRIKSSQRLRGLWPKKTMPIVADASRVAAREGLELSEQSLARTVAGAAATGEQTASEEATTTSAPKAKKGRKAKQDTTGEPGRDTGDGGTTVARKERHSLLNLAAKVLAEAGQPMTCKEMVDKVLATGLWQTKGKTPASTLYSAVLRECQTKGDAARFRKTERGKFESTR